MREIFRYCLKLLSFLLCFFAFLKEERKSLILILQYFCLVSFSSALGKEFFYAINF